jgi:hypothetical protein
MKIKILFVSFLILAIFMPSLGHSQDAITLTPNQPLWLTHSYDDLKNQAPCAIFRINDDQASCDFGSEDFKQLVTASKVNDDYLYKNCIVSDWRNHVDTWMASLAPLAGYSYGDNITQKPCATAALYTAEAALKAFIGRDQSIPGLQSDDFRFSRLKSHYLETARALSSLAEQCYVNENYRQMRLDLYQALWIAYPGTSVVPPIFPAEEKPQS